MTEELSPGRKRIKEEIEKLVNELEIATSEFNYSKMSEIEYRLGFYARIDAWLTKKDWYIKAWKLEEDK